MSRFGCVPTCFLLVCVCVVLRPFVSYFAYFMTSASACPDGFGHDSRLCGECLLVVCTTLPATLPTVETTVEMARDSSSLLEERLDFSSQQLPVRTFSLWKPLPSCNATLQCCNATVTLQRWCDRGAIEVPRVWSSTASSGAATPTRAG